MKNDRTHRTQYMKHNNDTHTSSAYTVQYYPAYYPDPVIVNR